MNFKNLLFLGFKPDELHGATKEFPVNVKPEILSPEAGKSMPSASKNKISTKDSAGRKSNEGILDSTQKASQKAAKQKRLKEFSFGFDSGRKSKERSVEKSKIDKNMERTPKKSLLEPDANPRKAGSEAASKISDLSAKGVPEQIIGVAGDQNNYQFLVVYTDKTAKLVARLRAHKEIPQLVTCAKRAFKRNLISTSFLFFR